MNRRLVFLSAVAAVLMMSVMAYGQQRGQGGRRGGMMGRGGNVVMLLRNEAVQKDVGISDEQKEKIQEVMASGRQGRGERPDFQNMTQEERQKWMEDRAKAAEAQLKKVGEILDKKQMGRLEQIRLQSMGAMAIMDEDVAKKLDITKEQQDKLRATQRELFQEMRDSGGRGAEAMAKIREKMEANVKDVLTDEQEAKLKDMLGKPFDISALRAGRNGRGNRGNRGN